MLGWESAPADVMLADKDVDTMRDMAPVLHSPKTSEVQSGLGETASASITDKQIRG